MPYFNFTAEIEITLPKIALTAEKAQPHLHGRAVPFLIPYSKTSKSYLTVYLHGVVAVLTPFDHDPVRIGFTARLKPEFHFFTACIFVVFKFYKANMMRLDRLFGIE